MTLNPVSSVRPENPWMVERKRGSSSRPMASHATELRNRVARAAQASVEYRRVAMKKRPSGQRKSFSETSNASRNPATAKLAR
jgi:hypothetical protein